VAVALGVVEVVLLVVLEITLVFKVVLVVEVEDFDDTTTGVLDETGTETGAAPPTV
jgi:hypothetical protein